MNSTHIKNMLLQDYRWHKGYSYVCTELWELDVVAYNPKTSLLTEVEVKISWADYKQEFKKVKYKDILPNHSNYRICKEFTYKNAPKVSNPHKKYFAAPKELAEKIKEDLDSVKSYFGVISIYRGRYLEVIRKAKKLPAGHMGENGITSMVSRMSSEMLRARLDLQSLIIRHEELLKANRETNVK